MITVVSALLLSCESLKSMVTSLQSSDAVGSSDIMSSPYVYVTSAGNEVKTGASLSTIIMVCVNSEELPQSSEAVHVRKTV